MNEHTPGQTNQSRFAANLLFLRQHEALSQEALADRLNVTRQSVSKWESGAAYPEMNTLLALCEYFSTDLDTLLRGDVRQVLTGDPAGYDRLMNRSAAAVAAGVALILFGTGLICGCNRLALFWTESAAETLGTTLLLLFVLAAVVLFVSTGIQKENFRKAYPDIRPFYTEKELETFRRRKVWLCTLPIAAILADVIFLVGLGGWAERGGWGDLLIMVFLWVIGGASAVLTWTNLQEDKYNIPRYNLSNTPAFRRKDEVLGMVCGVIMLLATALYIGFSASTNGWGIYWYFFAVGGILCGAVSMAAGFFFERRIRAQLREEDPSAEEQNF